MANSCQCDGGIDDAACKKLTADFRGLFLFQVHSDVTFEFEDGGEVGAHKAILVARVPVFEKMFASGMKESQTSRVEIKDADARSFDDFLHFIYCGKVPESFHAENMLVLAVRYDMPELVEHCLPCLKSEFGAKIHRGQPELMELEAKRLDQFSRKYNIPAIKTICEKEAQEFIQKEWKSLGKRQYDVLHLYGPEKGEEYVHKVEDEFVDFVIVSLVFAHVDHFPNLKADCITCLKRFRARFVKLGGKLKAHPELLLEMMSSL